jgi:hypothetical protein
VTKPTTATEANVVTITVRLPATKKCAKHHVNFPNENPMQPITSFYGATHGSSYCARCNGIAHKDRRVADKALRQEFREWKAARIA